MWNDIHRHFHIFESLHGCFQIHIFMSTHIYIACGVLITIFHNIFVVVRSAVLVMSSSGYEIRLPPAVIRTLFGSVFCVVCNQPWYGHMLQLCLLEWFVFGHGWENVQCSFLSHFRIPTKLFLMHCTFHVPNPFWRLDRWQEFVFGYRYNCDRMHDTIEDLL